MNSNFNKGIDILAKKIIPSIIIFIVIISLIVLTIFFKKISGNEEITEFIPKSHTIILIDQTDKLSDRCTKQLKEIFDKLPETIKPKETISIFSIYNNSDITITPILSLTNPGKNANQWYENIKHKREVFEKEFLTPLIKTTNGVNTKQESISSPIIETINNLIEWHKFSCKIPNRKLIIFSDMLQNSSHCSDYPSSKIVHPISEGCPKLNNMDNIIVVVYYILRQDKKHLQTQKHKKRWEKLFSDANASFKIRELSEL